MRILIVDDSKNKNEWIRRILEKENIQYDEITYMNGAYKKILNSPGLYDGIILDMQFPFYEDSQAEGKMGEKLLKRLKNRKIDIPVLGNSMAKFPPSTEYSFLKGNTSGYSNPKILKEFLENL